MAVFAPCGGWFVEQHQRAVHRFLKRMACRARNILVPSTQWEHRLVVVKERWLPFVRVVTSGAIICALTELIGMRIFMALAAAHRRAGELHMRNCQLEIRRAMTLRTGHGAVRPNQRESCGCMIEPGEILPLLCRVARLASEGLACFIRRSHALRKLTLMNVFMAGCT